MGPEPERDSGTGEQPVVDAGTGACGEPCAVGTKRCAGNGAQQCVTVAGCAVWTDVQACAAGEQCLGGSCLSCECTVGAKQCGAAGAQVCEGTVPSCGKWSAASACTASQRCEGGECVACAGAPGTSSSLTLSVGGETRYYWLHVPPSYTCAKAWPLLIDFHGTAGGEPLTEVEEYYALEGLKEVANAQGVVVARPRSRSAVIDGSRIFQWDINPGDLARNKAMAQALVAELSKQYHVDPARIWAAGFSNGTNMAAQFLQDDPPLFRGYAFFAGGLWSSLPARAFSPQAPRAYATTGYRDYMYSTLRTLRGYLTTNGFPDSQLWVRETDTGHELYGWHYKEALAFLDTGARPGAGALTARWTKESFPSTDVSLLAASEAPQGELVASGTGGSLWRRSASGAWSSAAQLSAGLNLTDVCLLPSGAGIAVGEGQVASTANAGASWTLAAPAKSFSGMFSSAQLQTVSCGVSGIFGAGYWDGVAAAAPAGPWSDVPLYSRFGPYRSQISGAAESSAGTRVAVGYYNYLGVSRAGGGFTALEPPTGAEWLIDVAWQPGGRWWVVGEKGTVLASTDDAASFAEQSSGTTEDLYAVAFVSATRGLAVGAHGMARYTNDAGATWVDVSTGLDAMLSDVVWVSATTAVVVGEKGTVLRFTAP